MSSIAVQAANRRCFRKFFAASPLFAGSSLKPSMVKA